MAIYKPYGMLERTGDVNQDVSRILDKLFTMDQDLHYIFGNLGKENFNPKELGSFIDLLKIQVEDNYSDDGSTAAALYSLAQSIIDTQQWLAALSSSVSRVIGEVANIDEWRENALTQTVKRTSEPVVIIPNGITKLMSIVLTKGRYLISASADVYGENIDTAQANIRIMAGSEMSDAGRYNGGTMSCYHVFLLGGETEVKLIGNHSGESDLTCERSEISVIRLGGEV